MKIGLFGGTFNPIHMGHMIMAQRVKESLGLDRLILIPSKLPPHKTTAQTSPADRFNMVQIVANRLGEGYEVSDFELKSEGVSYTFKTLTEYRSRFPEDELFFIAGSDIFATIASWQNWNDLFDLANFVIVNRKEVPFEEMLHRIPPSLNPRIRVWHQYEKAVSGEILLYTMQEVPVSSTEIRYRVATGTCGEVMLLDEVYEYIASNNLYAEVR